MNKRGCWLFRRFIEVLYKLKNKLKEFNFSWETSCRINYEKQRTYKSKCFSFKLKWFSFQFWIWIKYLCLSRKTNKPCFSSIARIYMEEDEKYRSLSETQNYKKMFDSAVDNHENMCLSQRSCHIIFVTSIGRIWLVNCHNPNSTSTQLKSWVWHENDFNPPPPQTQCHRYLSCYWPNFNQTLKLGSWDEQQQQHYQQH